MDSRVQRVKMIGPRRRGFVLFDIRISIHPPFDQRFRKRLHVISNLFLVRAGGITHGRSRNGLSHDSGAEFFTVARIFWPAGRPTEHWEYASAGVFYIRRFTEQPRGGSRMSWLP